jgi:hypothetical protein
MTAQRLHAIDAPADNAYTQAVRASKLTRRQDYAAIEQAKPRLAGVRGHSSTPTTLAAALGLDSSVDLIGLP